MASFTCALRCGVSAVCVTPMLSRGVDGSAASLLCRRDGRPFLQGASLAGAMRNWLAGQGEAPLAARLFGVQGEAGQLRVSDGEFSPETGRGFRPRLRVDGGRGCAGQGGKFETAQVPAGARFSFSLTWTGLRADGEAAEAVVRLLAALHQGGILLGGQKSNGFGRVRIEKALRRDYDLYDAGDRAAWLSDEEAGTPVDLSAAAASRQVRFTLSGHTGSILVRSGAREQGQVQSFTANLTENGRAILPGSSVKGAVRARAEAVAAFLGLREDFVEDFFGRGARQGDQGKAGWVRFEDAVLPERAYTVARIRIDKFTGGVMGEGLFLEKPHSGELTLRVSAPAGRPAECALLLFALRDLGLGLYGLGGGWAVGRGRVELREILVRMPSGDGAALRFDGGGGWALEDPQGVVKGWVEALEAARHEN